MKIAAYLASLLPSFGKEQVLEDCRLTRAELKDVTIPAFVTAAVFLKSYDFKSDEVKNKMVSFDRLVKGYGRDNMFVAISKGLNVALENLDQVESLVGKTYSEEVAGAGMTYLKANLLQFVEALAFVSKYSRRLLAYSYIIETAAIADSGTVVAESLTPAEIQWINLNFVTFCNVFNIVATGTNDVKKAFSNIPDIIVTTENAGTLGATIGENKIDPFEMKLIPISLNPIYHIGMFVAEWQANRYKAAQEESKLLQLRKLNLEKVHGGKPDARIQKEINYLESRVQGLNYKIEKMEKDHA